MKSANLFLVGFLSVSQALALQSCGSKYSGPGSEEPTAKPPVHLKNSAAEVLSVVNGTATESLPVSAGPASETPAAANERATEALVDAIIPIFPAPVGAVDPAPEAADRVIDRAPGTPVIVIIHDPETSAPVIEPAPVTPAPQIARFTVWLDILDKSLVGVPLNEISDHLVATSARAVTFNLQALGRLYADQHPMFETLLKKFKRLEDGIGDYQKWVDLEAEGRQSGASATVLARLVSNRDKARVNLDKALISTRFVAANPSIIPYTQELRAALEAYEWKDAADDRNDILQKLIAELDDIKAAKYDFSHLEDGNGVHEFRRKMRWFSMETRALNGMITLRPKNAPCPVPAYAGVVNDSIAKTKYAVLPGSPSELNPVKLSPCLYVQVAKLVEDVNVVKAKAELSDSLAEGDPTDAVEIGDQAKVQKMLDDLLAYDLFGLLQQELAAGMIH